MEIKVNCWKWRSCKPTVRQEFRLHFLFPPFRFPVPFVVRRRRRRKKERRNKLRDNDPLSRISSRAPPNVTGGGTQFSSRGFLLFAPKVASSFPQIFRDISSRDCEKDVSYPLLIWQMTGFSEALMRERREYVGRYSLINSILQMWQNSSHRIVQYNTVLLTDCHIT